MDESPIRKSKITDETFEDYLKFIYAGKSKTESATRIGVTRQAMYWHIKNHPESQQRIKEAEKALIEMVEDKLLRLAFSGTSLAAIKYYLENRCPDRWKSNQSKDDSSSRDDKYS